MNKQRPAATVAQSAELWPDIQKAKGSIPSTTSNGWVDTQVYNEIPATPEV